MALSEGYFKTSGRWNFGGYVDLGRPPFMFLLGQAATRSLSFLSSCTVLLRPEVFQLLCPVPAFSSGSSRPLALRIAESGYYQTV